MTAAIDVLSFRPASWYFRTAIRGSQTLEGSQRVGLWAVDELEYCKEQIRDLGGIPMRLYDPTCIGPDGILCECDNRQMELELDAG